jgi:hypothetical protein
MALNRDTVSASTKAPPRDWWRSAFIAVSAFNLVMLLTLIEHHFIPSYARNLPAIIRVASHILHGTPDWYAYQSRLFGPMLVKAVSVASKRPFQIWYIPVCIVLLAIDNAICLVVARKMGATLIQAVGAALVFAFLFVAMQDLRWMYLWDYIDIAIMFGLAYGIYANLSIGYFAVLCIIGLLNHEQALFIPIWLVLSSFRRDGSQRVTVDRARFASGFLLIVGGVLYTKEISHLLFRHFLDSDSAVTGRSAVLFGLPRNLNSLYKIELTWKFYLFLELTMVVLNQLKPVAGSRFWPIALTVGGFVLSNLLFGLIFELRVWLPLVPIVVVFALWILQASEQGDVITPAPEAT